MEKVYFDVIKDYTTTIEYNVGKNDSLLHFHHQVELLYVEKGKMRVIINDESKELEKGQLAIVDCFDSHQYITHRGASSFYLSIPVTYLKKYSSYLKNKKIKNHFVLDENRANKIHEWMNNVVASLKENELILDGTIQILLGLIIEDNLVDTKDKTNYDIVKNILIYIEENYKTSLTLESIALNFGYSKYYFSHLFNKCFSCNLNDYLNLVRCRHAIDNVIEEHMSVSDAAYQAGFISMRTFYRTFKKFFEMTPKEYFNNNIEKGSSKE